MHISRVAVLAFVLIVAGCGSQPYQPTAEQLSFRAKLNDTEAVEIVQRATRDARRATEYGVCYVSVNRNGDAPFRVNGDGIHFASFKRGEYLKQEGQNNKYYKKDLYTAHFRYHDITEIAYQDNRDEATLRCAAHFLITIATEKGVMTFGVPKAKVDPLMAALMHLAPQAKLTETSTF